MITAKEIAKALGGEVTGGNTALVPGPGHSRKDRSLAVTVSSTNPDGFVVHSHANDDPIKCRDYVRDMLGLAPFAPGRRVDKLSTLSRVAKLATRANATDNLSVAPDPDELKRIEWALKLWGEGRPPVGTLVETYLNSRALHLPEAVIAGDSIRFHPSCPYRVGDGVLNIPSMLCLMRDIHTGEPRALHRTALRADGRGKYTGDGFGSAKKMLGPVKGAAIMLTPFEDVTHGLSVAEGLENGLTVMIEKDAVPMWVLGSAGAVASFPYLGGVSFLTIYGDRGEAGEKAAEECALAWCAAGAEGAIVLPVGNDDWNAARINRGVAA